MLWRAILLTVCLGTTPAWSDMVPATGADTDRLLSDLDDLSQSLDHLETFRPHFPDPATADAYLAAWRDMIERNALLFAARDDVPGQAYLDYDQSQRPMVERIREASEILAHLRGEANWQGGPLFEYPFQLHEPTQRAVEASGLDPAGYLVQIMTQDRPEPFRLPGVQLTTALTLLHPADLSRPLAWSWREEVSAPSVLLEIGVVSDTPDLTVALLLSAPGAVFQPVPGADATTRCVPAGDRMECDAAIPEGQPLRLQVPLRPDGDPETLPAPYDWEIAVSVTGTAIAPGEDRAELPPAEIRLPFRSCNAALSAGLAAFFEDPTPPSNWSHRLAALAHVALRPDLPGRLNHRAPLPASPTAPGHSLPEILRNGFPAPIAPRGFEDLTPREQAVAIARQAATNRGPDDRLVEIGGWLAAGGRTLDGLRAVARVCPASSTDIPVVDIQLAEIDRLYRTVSDRRQVVEALYTAAARERDQQSLAFYEVMAQEEEAADGILGDLNFPEEPHRFGEEMYPGERLFVPAYRAFYNTGLYGILSLAGHSARVQATRTLLGPISIATSIWNVGSEIESYNRLRIQMGGALGWVEIAAYLRQLRARYEGLEVELFRVRRDYRALHDTACACRYE